MKQPKSKKSNKSSCKYQLLVEGEMDEIFINFIKVHYLKSRNKSICNKHSYNYIQCIHKFESYLSNYSCCSNSRWVVCDKDELTDDLIKKIKSTSNLNLIISYPSIEIVLASFFKEITQENISTKKLENIINKGLEKHRSKIKYMHNTKFIQEFCKFLENNIYNHNIELFDIWRKNLKTLEKKGTSNFIKLIEYFEG